MKKWKTGLILVSGVTAIILLNETTSFGANILSSGSEPAVEVNEEVPSGKQLVEESLGAMSSVESFHFISEELKDSGEVEVMMEGYYLAGDTPKIYTRTTSMQGKEPLELYVEGEHHYIQAGSEWIQLPSTSNKTLSLNNFITDPFDEWSDMESFVVNMDKNHYVLSKETDVSTHKKKKEENPSDFKSEYPVEMVIDKDTYLLKEYKVETSDGTFIHTLSSVNQVEESIFPQVKAAGSYDRNDVQK
ncbi:hypothetical protein [Halobacillus sp. Cin3]|uniref:hypothetical protein n=1 Tax=Halobacillus sp. Cin3 TaxID=2928441 RepID=UPI00248DCFCB|nr:hypothetical protein [Halobacillus sp. Cin3]